VTHDGAVLQLDHMSARVTPRTVSTSSAIRRDHSIVDMWPLRVLV
jgi:hypothetical protein